MTEEQKEQLKETLSSCGNCVICGEETFIAQGHYDAHKIDGFGIICDKCFFASGIAKMMPTEEQIALAQKFKEKFDKENEQ